MTIIKSQHCSEYTGTFSGRIYASFFIFFIALVFTSVLARDTFTVQKITQLQYEIGRNADMLSKPSIEWSGDGEVLLIDSQTLFLWKKKKLIQIASPYGNICKVILSPDGSMFLCADENGAAALGATGNFEFRPLSEKLTVDRVIWSRDNSRFYYLKGTALYVFEISRFYGDILCDGVCDFYLSDDEKRLVLRMGRSEERESQYTLINADRSCKKLFHRGMLFHEDRVTRPFLKNLSGDFRKLIMEKRSAPGKGFGLFKIDWRNVLIDEKQLLDDCKGDQDAVFSADHGKIALTCRDGNDDPVMLVLSAAGDILVKFSPKKGWSYRAPLWSPHSEWILWNYIDVSRNEGERKRFLITDPNGVALQFLTGNFSNLEIDWSPRGEYLLMREEAQKLEHGEYIIYDLREKKSKELFKDNRSRITSRPAWSPDGRFVAVIDYSTFQKREKKIEKKGTGQREYECVYFREQVFLYRPSDDSLQLLW